MLLQQLSITWTNHNHDMLLHMTSESWVKYFEWFSYSWYQWVKIFKSKSMELQYFKALNMVNSLAPGKCGCNFNPLWPSDAIWWHRSRSTLVQVMAYRHQAITWTNVDLSSVKSCHIYLRVISQEILKRSIHDKSFKNVNSWSELHLPGANELKV